MTWILNYQGVIRVSQDPALSSIRNVGREERVNIGSDLVKVLKYDKRLDHGLFICMKKNRDLLKNRVRSKQEPTFVTQIFLDVLILDALEFQRELNPRHEYTSMSPKKLHFTLLCHWIYLKIMILDAFLERKGWGIYRDKLSYLMTTYLKN